MTGTASQLIRSNPTFKMLQHGRTLLCLLLCPPPPSFSRRLFILLPPLPPPDLPPLPAAAAAPPAACELGDTVVDPDIAQMLQYDVIDAFEEY